VLEPNIVGAGVTRRQNPFIGRELDTRPYNIVVNAAVRQQIVASSPATKLSIGSNRSELAGLQIDTPPPSGQSEDR
jgi:hypothetical protein